VFQLKYLVDLHATITIKHSGYCNLVLATNSNTCVATSCEDGIKSGTETDIDCGGAECGLCSLHQNCSASNDCFSGTCYNATCKNIIGGNCTSSLDCGSNICNLVTSLCVATTCEDGIINGNEIGIDCGSASGCAQTTCSSGQPCLTGADCSSSYCNTTNYCQSSPLCGNGQLDTGETDIDCGGICGSTCNVTQSCLTSTDCILGWCDVVTSFTCQSTSCTDGRHDGTETDIDCGGLCTPCPLNYSCQIGNDCQSGKCHSLKCDGECGQGTYDNITNCVPCITGTASSATNVTSCPTCTVGTYTNTTGQTSCSSCLKGTVGISSTLCVPCVPGRYSAVDESTFCVACNNGQSSSVGSSSCSACANGTYAVGGDSSCSTCTGGYKVDALQTACSACQPSTAGNDGITCQSCTAGYYTSGYASTSCQPCPAGNYSGAGYDHCIGCSAGYYSASMASGCLPCSAGKVTTQEGVGTCVSCLAGKSTGMATGGSSCSICAVGRYATIGATTCTACVAALGEFQPSPGQSSCETCTGYTYFNGTSCIVAPGSIVYNTQSLATLSESSITVYWEPPSGSSNIYYALQLVTTTSSSVSTSINYNWPLITTIEKNFTFFGLLPATTYSLVLLTIPQASVIGGSGSAYSTYSFSTLPHVPVITSMTAAPNPSGAFGVGATITVVFDVDTNKVNGTNGTLACSFTPSQSNTFVGVWINARTYVMTVLSVSGQQPSIGAVKAVFPSVQVIQQSISIPSQISVVWRCNSLVMLAMS
jgi:hypothetical protein